MHANLFGWEMKRKTKESEAGRPRRSPLYSKTVVGTAPPLAARATTDLVRPFMHARKSNAQKASHTQTHTHTHTHRDNHTLTHRHMRKCMFK